MCYRHGRRRHMGIDSEPHTDDRKHNDQGNRPPAGSASGIHAGRIVTPLPTGDHREHEVLTVQQTLK